MGEESDAELNVFAAGDIVVCATSVEATESMKGHLVRSRWHGAMGGEAREGLLWGVVTAPGDAGHTFVQFEHMGYTQAIPNHVLRHAPAEMQGPVVPPPDLQKGMEVDIGRGAGGGLAGVRTGIVRRMNRHDESVLVEVWDSERGVEREIFCWPEALVPSTRLRLRVGQRALAYGTLSVQARDGAVGKLHGGAEGWPVKVEQWHARSHRFLSCHV